MDGVIWIKTEKLSKLTPVFFESPHFGQGQSQIWGRLGVREKLWQGQFCFSSAYFRVFNICKFVNLDQLS